MNPAQIIADNLAALPHPDGTPRQMPGFQSALLPEPLQEQVKQSATDIGAAIINLLELNGLTVVSQDQVRQPTQLSPQQVGNVHCNVCDQRLFQLNIVTPEKILVSTRTLIAGISAINPECPHAAV
jgi:hypothetical protein